MKILVIKLTNTNIISSATIRTLALIKGLLFLGHNIDYITLANNAVDVETDYGPFMDQIKMIKINNNENIYKKLAQPQKSKFFNFCVNIIRKLYHATCIYEHNINAIKKINLSILPSNEYDLVITSSDPKISHLAMIKLKKQGLKYGKWIQYWGDPMTLDISRDKLMPKFILKHEEKRLLSKADRIMYVSPFTLSEQKHLFPTLKEKMFFAPIPYLDEQIYPNTCNKEFVIGYYGNYYKKVRNMIPFYSAMKEMDKKVFVDIFGNNDILLENTPNIHIHPASNIEENKAKADLLICVLNSHGNQIPGKLYHYAGTNKAILVILDGENQERIKEYLSSFNRFLFCYNEKNDIKAKIEEIIRTRPCFEPCQLLSYKQIAKEFI